MMDEYHLRDLFQGLGGITIRKMFGGQGIYHQGVIIAVVVDGELLLKADGETVPEFEAAGCQQWAYEGKSKSVRMPYWRVPGEALDDPEDFTPWARLAYAAGLRAGRKR
jgi:DNA transformation protein